jgi:formate hydrogenlyase subunit 6/NADH:ubiquinone oxidoreductase subunit I
MLKILKMIAGNMIDDKATVRLPGSVPTPALFRGAVTLNPEKCIGCGMCSYVCVSNAVTGSDQGKAYAWAYEPGRCTFCARCVDRCPGRALSMSSAQVPCYEHPGDLSSQHLVTFHACAECGEPVRLASDELLKRAFDHVKQETLELVRLCERCRRRHLQRSMIASAFVDHKERNQ